MDGSDEPIYRLFKPSNNRIYGFNRRFSELVTYNAAKAPFRQMLYSVLARPGQLMTNDFSMVVSLDGSCRGSGNPYARSAYGVYFGPNSVYNLSGAVPVSSTMTSRYAEIYAAIKAIEKILEINQGDFAKNHVILITDSDYFVKAITMYLEGWKQRGWLNSRGTPVQHGELFQHLENLITGMEEDGIVVEFWRVGRELNPEADHLLDKVYST